MIIGDGAAEPGGVPEKKRHEDEEQREDEDSQSPAAAERFLWLGVGSHSLVIGCIDSEDASGVVVDKGEGIEPDYLAVGVVGTGGAGF